MTPDDHAARARDLLRTADEILARAIDANTERPSENPMVHQQVQTLALLAQVHATLSLRQPDLPPSSAGAPRPSSGVPNLSRSVPAPTGQAASEPLGNLRWERLSETDFTDFGLPDDSDLPDLDEAADGPVEHRDYRPPQEALPPDAYDDDDDDLQD
jgi:hypothetical protein